VGAGSRKENASKQKTWGVARHRHALFHVFAVFAESAIVANRLTSN
jgi:hypothetical protein